MPNLAVETSSDNAGFEALMRAVGRYEKAIEKATKASKAMETAVNRLAAAQKKTAKTQALLTAGLNNGIAAMRAYVQAGLRTVARAFVDTIDESVRFNEAIAEVSTLIRGDASVQMDKMRQAALRMAGEFGQMPTVVVKAFYDTISAGATSAAASMNVMNAAGKLAVGGLVDMQSAAKGIVSILQAFDESGNEFAEAGRLADIFFVAMQKGITRVPELVENMGRVAGSAKIAGLSMEELFAATAAVTTRGLNTEAAVVGMNQALKVFAKVTEGGATAAQRFGIPLEQLQQGGFGEWLAKAAALLKTNKQEFTKLFPNVRATRAMFALLTDDLFKYTEIVTAMETKTGAAEEAMKKIADTTAFQIRQFKALTSAVQISFADFLTKSEDAKGVLMGVNQALAFVVTRVSSLNTSSETASTKMAELTRGAIADFLTGLGDVMIAVGSSIIAYAQFSRSIASVTEWMRRLARMAFIAVAPFKPLGVAIESAVLLFDQLAGIVPEEENFMDRIGQGFKDIGAQTKLAAIDLRLFKTEADGTTKVGLDATAKSAQEEFAKLKAQLDATHQSMVKVNNTTSTEKKKKPKSPFGKEFGSAMTGRAAGGVTVGQDVFGDQAILAEQKAAARAADKAAQTQAAEAARRAKGIDERAQV